MASPECNYNGESVCGVCRLIVDLPPGTKKISGNVKVKVQNCESESVNGVQVAIVVDLPPMTCFQLRYSNNNNNNNSNNKESVCGVCR